MDEDTEAITIEDCDIRVFSLALSGYEKCKDQIAVFGSYPGIEYLIATIVKYTRKKDLYRIVGFLVKRRRSPVWGLFAYRFRGVNEPEAAVRAYIRQEPIRLKAPAEKEQKLKLKIRGKSHTVRSFVKWLWSLEADSEGDTPAKFEFGNQSLVVEYKDFNAMFTDIERATGLYGFGRFPLLGILRKDVK